MEISGIVKVIHIMAASTFVVTMAVMQIVTGPALAKIAPGEDKQKAAAIIGSRARPAMDIAIIIMNITVAYLLWTKWYLIGTIMWLHIKTTFGFTALIIANLIHFYWRPKKAKLKEAGRDLELKKLNKRTLFLEKVVLVCAAITWFMGVSFNHLFQ